MRRSLSHPSVRTEYTPIELWRRWAASADSEISCHSSSRCTVSRSLVQLFVLATRRPEIHNTISDYSVQFQQSLARSSHYVSTLRVALHCCLNEKNAHFSQNVQPSFVLCLTFGRMPIIIAQRFRLLFPFRYLTHEGWFGFSDGLVPFGMLPFTAPFPCLLSLFCNRCPSEGELGRSHLPLPFFRVMSCHVGTA